MNGKTKVVTKTYGTSWITSIIIAFLVGLVGYLIVPTAQGFIVGFVMAFVCGLMVLASMIPFIGILPSMDLDTLDMPMDNQSGTLYRISVGNIRNIADVSANTLNDIRCDNLPSVHGDSRGSHRCFDRSIVQLNTVKTKKSHPFLVKKETAEEKSWSDYERGYDEGYNAGIVDFEAVEIEKQKLRDKGIPVIGDKKNVRTN